MTGSFDLGWRNGPGSVEMHGTGQVLDIYLGTCTEHDRPVRHEGQHAGAAGPGRYWIPCPQGGHRIEAERLVAITTTVFCSGECTSARRADCSCSCACGGVNHGKSWAHTATRQDFESALAAYRGGQAKTETRRQQRREARQRQQRQAFGSWASQHSNLLTALEAYRNCDSYTHECSHAGPCNSFLADLARQVGICPGDQIAAPRKTLTSGQVQAAQRALKRDREHELARQAREAARRPCPEGKRLRVTGEIVKVTLAESSHGPGLAIKMTVAAAGYAVHATMPKALVSEGWRIDNEYCRGGRETHDRRGRFSTHSGSERWTRHLKGTRVTIAADITRSDRDESFGFAKRPALESFELPA